MRFLELQQSLRDRVRNPAYWVVILSLWAVSSTFMIMVVPKPKLGNVLGLQAFEAAAVDYLLKPVTEDRLTRTLDRLRQHQIPRRKGPEIAALLPSQSTRFPARAGEGFVFLEMKKVTHFEVEDEIVSDWAGERYKTSWSTLGDVEEAFPEEELLRIHLHLLLRPSTVLGFRPLMGGRGEVRVTGGKTIEVSRGSVPKLKAALGLASKLSEG